MRPTGAWSARTRCCRPGYSTGNERWAETTPGSFMPNRRAGWRIGWRATAARPLSCGSWRRLGTGWTSPVRTALSDKLSPLSGCRVPNLQGAMPGHMAKIVVGREHRQIVPDAKLRQESVDRADLNAGTAASIPQLSGIDVI